MIHIEVEIVILHWECFFFNRPFVPLRHHCFVVPLTYSHLKLRHLQIYILCDARNNFIDLYTSCSCGLRFVTICLKYICPCGKDSTWVERSLLVSLIDPLVTEDENWQRPSQLDIRDQQTAICGFLIPLFIMVVEYCWTICIINANWNRIKEHVFSNLEHFCPCKMDNFHRPYREGISW